MTAQSWWNEIDAAVTVCDAQGIILEMNDQAVRTFAADGGRSLLGKNFWDCHPELAREKIRRIMETQTTNCYTIEKNGVKKMIYQTPWYEKGVFRGLVEISLVIPSAMSHFVRG
jgi:transcriptional regulator with PAS, ATPase and Fis domain